MDDILDVTSNETLLGKPTGSDANLLKLNYVSLLGREKAKDLVMDFTNKAIAALKSFKGYNTSNLEDLSLSLADRIK
jgi:geranylgeranyl pyrophosphate synthase